MRTSLRFHKQILLALAICFCIPVAQVLSQTIQSSIEQLVRESDAVVVGRVARLSSEWNETRSRIQTRVLIAVDQSVKGDASTRSMTVIVPGGEVDGVGEIYSHAPRFLHNEAVVVFAKKNAAGQYQVSDGDQGKYTILKNEVSNRLSVAGGKTLEEFTATIKTALQVQQMK